ncbi:AAA family ATPase [Streptomyces sp. SCUT-3]|uniref:ATP-binding protein n=1 Tax=Streptomyces TaxID=1883 RepID=UPI0015FDCB18|nr:ATP-binding protein [Streptomyces sp. SCUT-3]QMV21064.1 AAA family ATPase [Streptomyces sp. SCUT-3]
MTTRGSGSTGDNSTGGGTGGRRTGRAPRASATGAARSRSASAKASSAKASSAKASSAGSPGAVPQGTREGVHQRALAAAVLAVLGHVDAHAARASSAATGRAGAGAPVPPAATPEPEARSALETLCSCFGLTPFERDTLVLAAATELDPTAAARCAAAGGSPERPYPTFSLALAALPGPHWSALTPVAPLRRWQLVALDDEASPTGSRLRIDERILHFLTGTPYLDVRLHGLVRRAAAPEDLPGPHGLTARRIAAAWSSARADGPPHVELTGADRRTRLEVAAAAARLSGLGLYSVEAGDLPVDPAERDRLSRLWQREAVLLPAALLVEMPDAPGADRAAAGPGAVQGPGAADAFTADLAVPVAVASDEPRPAAAATGRERLSVPDLTSPEQLAVWTSALADVPGVSEQDLRALVAQFSLPAHVIRSAADSVRRAVRAGEGTEEDGGTGRGPGPGPGAGGLAWHAGLTEARMALDELGRRIEPRAGWDDLVLAERQRRILREIVAHVRQRATVHQDWGFEAVLRRGLGVTALFAGSSGTGKTLAAEVMAGELGVDLFVIDLSQVVSKYIGETEKNLRRVFDAAERGGALLLFDEADSLFGKRSEVKDSHDRYANLEVSYLLMRMEAYRGLAVLTTNMKKALDTAFMRRIRFVVDFAFPAVPERAEIWRRVIPAQVPSEGIDHDLLAQLTVAGGSIRNIALAGAFLAADEGGPLRMRHLLAAARTEYLKLERSLTPAEVRGWA